MAKGKEQTFMIAEVGHVGDEGWSFLGEAGKGERHSELKGMEVAVTAKQLAKVEKERQGLAKETLASARWSHHNQGQSC